MRFTVFLYISLPPHFLHLPSLLIVLLPQADNSFQSFVKTSSHVMTRALGLSNSIDILKDYTGADRGNSSGGHQNALMSKVRNFQNPSVQDRPIMDIQVSPHHPELFLVAYGSKPANSSSSDTRADHSTSSPALTSASYDNQPGLLCLWSVILKDTPEFVFTAPSPVLTARFHSDDPHLIIGGCYSGQVVMWDTRVSSHRPTTRSAIAGKGHKHPVYSMCLAKSGVSSPILITASTDGTLCHWDLTNLNDPISSTILLAPMMTHASELTQQPSSSSALGGSGGGNSTPLSYMLVNSSHLARGGKPVSASSMSLGPDEDNRKLIIGTEGGALCLFTLPLKPNTQFEQVSAHYGMITAITVNTSTVKPFKDLILTSSVDWTVKLWNIQRIGTAPSPIFEFSASAFDYYSSVRWCPIHPGIFTTITSGGVLMLWNLCQSIVEPVATLQLHQEEREGGKVSATPAVTAVSMSALNKTVWTADGKKLLIGDSRLDLSTPPFFSSSDSLLSH
jgi:dynein intermediate chain, cytosolic